MDSGVLAHTAVVVISVKVKMLQVKAREEKKKTTSENNSINSWGCLLQRKILPPGLNLCLTCKENILQSLGGGGVGSGSSREMDKAFFFLKCGKKLNQNGTLWARE